MGDGEILDAIAAGEPTGLAAAYDHYAPELYSYCASLLSDPASAADALEDTFVVAAALQSLRDASQLKAWLYAVARNECHRRVAGDGAEPETSEAFGPPPRAAGGLPGRAVVPPQGTGTAGGADPDTDPGTTPVTADAPGTLVAVGTPGGTGPSGEAPDSTGAADGASADDEAGPGEAANTAGEAGTAGDESADDQPGTGGETDPAGGAAAEDAVSAGDETPAGDSAEGSSPAGGDTAGGDTAQAGERDGAGDPAQADEPAAASATAAAGLAAASVPAPARGSAGPPDAEDVGPRSLVRAALATLTSDELEVVELSLRYELDGPGLARVLGVSRRKCRGLVTRAQAEFAKSLRAVLVTRSGRAGCPVLTSLLAGWNGVLTRPLRDEIMEHAAGCVSCGPRGRRELSPGVLLGMLPTAVIPATLRDKVLRLIADTSPAAQAYRARLTRRAGPFDRAGFPRQSGPQRGPAGARSPALTTVAVITAVAVAGAAAAIAEERLMQGDGSGSRPGQASALPLLAPPTFPTIVPSSSPKPHRDQPGRARVTPPRSVPVSDISSAGQAPEPAPAAATGRTGQGGQRPGKPADTSPQPAGTSPKPAGTSPEPSPAPSPGSQAACLTVIVLQVCAG
jgi:DNA-directed RNA polymerase specialized sigma24 family protein